MTLQDQYANGARNVGKAWTDAATSWTGSIPRLLPLPGEGTAGVGAPGERTDRSAERLRFARAVFWMLCICVVDIDGRSMPTARRGDGKWRADRFVVA
jgi:hypothetical protein